MIQQQGPNKESGTFHGSLRPRHIKSTLTQSMLLACLSSAFRQVCFVKSSGFSIDVQTPSRPEKFLPLDIDYSVEDCYDTLCGLADKEYWPYSKAQFDIFNEAYRAHQVKLTCLGCCGYSTIILLPTTLTAVGLYTLAPGNAIAAFATVIISNISSMVFTGTLPSMDSDKQNKDQNALIALKSRFYNLGEFLLDECAFGERERIVVLALKIDVNWIRDILNQVTTQPDRDDDVLRHFSVCVDYLKDPHSTITRESGNQVFVSALRRRGLASHSRFHGLYQGRRLSVSEDEIFAENGDASVSLV